MKRREFIRFSAAQLRGRSRRARSRQGSPCALAICLSARGWVLSGISKAVTSSSRLALRTGLRPVSAFGRGIVKRQSRSNRYWRSHFARSAFRSEIRAGRVWIQRRSSRCGYCLKLCAAGRQRHWFRAIRIRAVQSCELSHLRLIRREFS